MTEQDMCSSLKGVCSLKLPGCNPNLSWCYGLNIMILHKRFRFKSFLKWYLMGNCILRDNQKRMCTFIIHFCSGLFITHNVTIFRFKTQVSILRSFKVKSALLDVFLNPQKPNTATRRWNDSNYFFPLAYLTLVFSVSLHLRNFVALHKSCVSMMSCITEVSNHSWT